jgi:hypothetical protein
MGAFDELRQISRAERLALVSKALEGPFGQKIRDFVEFIVKDPSVDAAKNDGERVEAIEAVLAEAWRKGMLKRLQDASLEDSLRERGEDELLALIRKYPKRGAAIVKAALGDDGEAHYAAMQLVAAVAKHAPAYHTDSASKTEAAVMAWTQFATCVPDRLRKRLVAKDFELAITSWTGKGGNRSKVRAGVGQWEALEPLARRVGYKKSADVLAIRWNIWSHR